MVFIPLSLIRVYGLFGFAIYNLAEMYMLVRVCVRIFTHILVSAHMAAFVYSNGPDNLISLFLSLWLYESFDLLSFSKR